MRITKLLLIQLSFIRLNSCAQKLTCSDFKIETFYTPETEAMSKYTNEANDSIAEILPERDLAIMKYIVVRKKNTQIKWKT